MWTRRDRSTSPQHAAPARRRHERGEPRRSQRSSGKCGWGPTLHLGSKFSKPLVHRLLGRRACGFCPPQLPAHLHLLQRSGRPRPPRDSLRTLFGAARRALSRRIWAQPTSRGSGGAPWALPKRPGIRQCSTPAGHQGRTRRATDAPVGRGGERLLLRCVQRGAWGSMGARWAQLPGNKVARRPPGGLRAMPCLPHPAAHQCPPACPAPRRACTSRPRC